MITLLNAELRRRWSLIKAYPVDELVETVMLAVFFYLIFLGAKYMAGPTASFGDRLDAASCFLASSDQSRLFGGH